MSRAYETYVGKELGGFTIQRLLGAGGMGAVFLANQVRLDRPVALKLLSVQEAGIREQVERFAREAKVLARLNHPAIVQIYDMLHEDDLLWLAMEYVAWGSASAYLRANRPLPIWLAASIARDAALGLSAAAVAGVVHRDVKPDNLLLTEHLYAKIADFGLARALEDTGELTRSGVVMGTARYMSPEQWQDARQVDHRADLYSLGCTLYELLVGVGPFPGPAPYNYMTQHCSDPVPDPRSARADIPPALADIIRKLLSKKAEDRYPSGAELARALEEASPPRPSDVMPSALVVGSHPPPSAEEVVLPPHVVKAQRGADVTKVTPLLLIVDDEPALTRGLERMLKREGYETIVAHDGETAIELAGASNPALILLDVELPGMSGLDVLQQLRKNGNGVPVIVVTGEGEEADKVHGFRLGADDYVTKPYGLAELLARVQARLKRR